MGPILAATSAAPMMSATAAMPAPWPPVLLQHGGLHMTSRLAVGSVKHATHLFLLLATGGIVWLAGLEGERPPGPAPRCQARDAALGGVMKAYASTLTPSAVNLTWQCTEFCSSRV